MVIPIEVKSSYELYVDDIKQENKELKEKLLRKEKLIKLLMPFFSSAVEDMIDFVENSHYQEIMPEEVFESKKVLRKLYEAMNKKNVN